MEHTIIVKWRVKASALDRVLALLPELAEKTRLEEGNLSYTVYQSESDPQDIFLCETYADAEALEAHRKTEHYTRIVAGEIRPQLEGREVAVVKKLA